MNLSNKFRIVLFSLAIVTIYCLLFGITSTVNDWHKGIIYGDAFTYFQFAQAILDGSLINESSKYSVSLVARTPGYPVLIAAASFVPLPLNNALYLCQFLLGLLTIFSLTWLFQELPKLLIGASSMTILWQFRFYLNAMLTEWLAITLLLLWLGTVYSILLNRSWMCLINGFILSWLILIRPVFQLLIPFSILLAILPASNNRIGRFGQLIAGLIPVVFWMTINFYRLGEFSVSPYGGYALFLPASLLGEAPITQDDPPEFKRFAVALNDAMRPRYDYSRSISDQMHSQDFIEERIFKTDFSLWHIAEPLRVAQGLTVSTANKWLTRYSRRVILENKAKYYSYVGVQLSLYANRIILTALYLLVFVIVTIRFRWHLC